MPQKEEMGQSMEANALCRMREERTPRARPRGESHLVICGIYPVLSMCGELGTGCQLCSSAHKRQHTGCLTLTQTLDLLNVRDSNMLLSAPSLQPSCPCCALGFSFFPRCSAPQEPRDEGILRAKP